MPSTAPEVSVSTVAATATSTGHHMLKIEGYKHLKDIHRYGEYFESCRFQAAGHTWKIRCYPNGDYDAFGYITLFLMRDDRDEDEDKEGKSAGVVHAKFRFALVYPRSRLLPWPPYAKTNTYNFQNLKGWGFGRFMSVKRLERSGFLKGDCFAVRCDIIVIEKSAVKDEVVKVADMARLGMLCKCKDDLCKRHNRP